MLYFSFEKKLCKINSISLTEKLDIETVCFVLILQNKKMGEYMIIENLYYTETHEWIKVDGDKAYLGITDYAQHELGDIVYVELPESGDDINTGEAFGSIEAVKAVEDLIAPISGEVLKINENLADNPELINKSAFEEGWLIQIKIADKGELDKLLNSKAYEKLIEE